MRSSDEVASVILGRLETDYPLTPRERLGIDGARRHHDPLDRRSQLGLRPDDTVDEAVMQLLADLYGREAVLLEPELSPSVDGEAIEAPGTAGPVEVLQGAARR